MKPLRIASKIGATCLAAGSLAVTGSGMVPVEQLQPGHLLIGRTEGGTEVHAKVVRNDSIVAGELVAVGLDGQGVLQATPSHPVWRVGSGWTPVGELQAGDRLAARTGEVEVTSVSRLSGPALVHNLSVEAPHTYFAGAELVLSHNKVVGRLQTVIQNVYDSGIDSLHRLTRLGKGGDRLGDLEARLAAFGTKGEFHHVFPKQFRQRFEAIGIDIDRYIMRIPKERHRLKPGGLHTGPNNWNKWWERFWDRYPEDQPQPSIDEVMDKLDEMMRRFGLE